MSHDTVEAQGNAIADAAAKTASSHLFVSISANKTSESDAVNFDTQQIQSSLMDANTPALEVWPWVYKVVSLDSAEAWTKG